MLRHIIKAPLLACLFLTSSASLSNTAFHYEVINTYPHDRSYFTQGLEVINNIVYESTGLYGASRLVKYRLGDSKALQQQELPNRYFGEGLTVLNNKIYQLTWKSGRVFVYDQKNLNKLDSLSITTQGWGLSNNGQQLIYSDGSAYLRFLDPISQRVTKQLQVTDQGRPVTNLNELEWVEGRIYANVWQSDTVIMISPETGKVVGKVNFSKLLPKPLHRHNTGVLNGIAYDHVQKSLYITGKRWPTIYQVRLQPAQPSTPSTTAE